MGIPYYFASLIRQHKGIVSRVGSLQTPDVFAVDFNCLIHQYLDESNPVQSILAALQAICKDTCHATKHTYIAMDGLVPYGKIVQQRYRRFRTSPTTSVFDRHQISPDTPYMRELADAIRRAFPTFIVSDTSEPGEGEHKLLNWLKTLDPSQRRSVCVYGLDADLILLCLAQKQLSKPFAFSLLRENTTFNKDVPGFSTLSIWKLAEKVALPIGEYIRLCVLCFGNDFMPALGMFSLREGGHERAVQLYKEVGANLETAEGRSTFLKVAATRELSIFMEKVASRKKKGERAIIPMDGLHWKERYTAHVLDGASDTQSVVSAFWKSYHWTLAYFETNQVPDWSWVYPYPDAPLVSQIVEFPEHTPTFCGGEPPFKTTNQLQCILPIASLRRAKRRVLFPDEFYDEETETRMPWMKRYAWESKPRISIPWHPTETETRILEWDPKALSE